MASIPIGNLDDDLKCHLRACAAEHGRWIAEEARDILRQIVSQPNAPRKLGEQIHARFTEVGGIDLAPTQRGPMRAEPAQIVLNWFGQHDPANLFVTAVAEAELRTGVAILPDGQRHDWLQQAIDAMIDQDFRSRVLPFDSLAANAYAEIVAQRRAAGRPIAAADCQIAAIARADGTSVATRNVKDFDGCGICLINPWNDL